MDNTNQFLDEAVALARDNVFQGGRPFGAVIVKDGKVIARGVNRIQADCDPTAHAELQALRAAGKALRSPRLEGCSVYASGQPCPMCLAAIRMSGISDVTFAYSNEQAEPFGLSTAAIAAELAKPFGQQEGLSMKHRAREVPDEANLYQIWLDHAATHKKPAASPVSSQVTFFYYGNLAEPERFYGELLGLEKTFDKGWVKFFRITEHSYVGLVDEAKGHHNASEAKSVMLSMETPDLEGWYARMKATGVDIVVHFDAAKAADQLVSTFLMRDPGGYSVEFFRFNKRD